MQYFYVSFDVIAIDYFRREVFSVVVDYLEYKLKYTGSIKEVPEFEIAEEMAYDLILTACFLQC